MGLYDGVMVKDNPLLAKPDLPSILNQLRQQQPGLLLALEADTVEQVRRFVTWPEVDVILLDNMTLEEMRTCVALRRPGLKFEASGGLNLGLDYLPGSIAFDHALAPPPEAALAADVVWFDAYISNVERTARNTILLLWHKQIWIIYHGDSIY